MLFFSLAANVRGQAPLEVRVTSVAGQSIYIDAGRDAGVRPGMFITFYRTSGVPVQAVVRDVSANNARTEMLEPGPVVLVGVRGEIILPPAPVVPDDETPDKGNDDPEHPPWKRTETDRDPDEPLLAPAYGRRPEEQETKVRGRIFTLMRFTQDRGGDRSNSYSFGRLGTRLDISNPFRRGGNFKFAGSVDQRQFDVAGDSQTDRNLLINRISYSRGGQEYSPYRFEVGRFQSVFVPEVGLVDGAEGAVQLQSGWQLGGGAGSYPEPFPALQFGQDFGLHMFANYQSTGKSALSTGIAYQQTWHEGAADRNLLIGRINARPTDTIWVYGLALLDVYTSSDEINGSGIKLTQGTAQVRFTPDRFKGGQFTYTRTSYPELKRDDFAFLPDDLVRDGYVDRINASGWVRASERVRLRARANMWRDQDNSGNGGEVSADWNDVWRDTSALHAALYYSDGTFVDGIGTRLQVRERLRGLNVSASYNGFFYNTKGLVTGDESLARHTLRADVNWSRGRWYYSVNGSYSLGDREKQVGLGMYIEYRF
jgi:hypothetical protein